MACDDTAVDAVHLAFGGRATAMCYPRNKLRHRGSHHARSAQIYLNRLACRTLNGLADENGLTPARARQLCHLATARPVVCGRSATNNNPLDGLDLRTYFEQLLTDTPEKEAPPVP